jgi:uncharacterized protein YgfB (UPF0149 family)
MLVRVLRAKKLFLSGDNHMVNPAETDFDAVEQALRVAGALGEAAEIHGDFCGQACLIGLDAVPPWISDVLANTHSAQAGRVLESLAAQTWTMLDEGDMSFLPLLPSDEVSLESRADNLGLWCQGFVHGLGIAGAQGDDNPAFKEGPTRDIIEDFSQISRAAFAENESADEAETAYIELLEYVRVSVQLVFEELYPLRPRPAGPGTH